MGPLRRSRRIALGDRPGQSVKSPRPRGLQRALLGRSALSTCYTDNISLQVGAVTTKGKENLRCQGEPVPNANGSTSTSNRVPESRGATAVALKKSRPER